MSTIYSRILSIGEIGNELKNEIENQEYLIVKCIRSNPKIFEN